MGCWSRPVCVKPNGLKLDYSKVNASVREHLSHCGYEEDSQTTTAEELHSQCVDTAKIYGYLEQEELEAWSALLAEVSRQNSNTEVEFHFYCSDNQFPFYFSYSPSGKFETMVGKQNAPDYTDNTSDSEASDSEASEEEKEVEFSQTKYLALYDEDPAKFKSLFMTKEDKQEQDISLLPAHIQREYRRLLSML